MTMQADAQLVDVFRNMRRDARNEPTPTEVAQTLNIEFVFDGAGQTPTIGDVLIFPIGLLVARLVGAQLVADVAGTASVELTISTLTSWPTRTPVAPVTPSLTLAAATALDVTGWVTAIQHNDILSARLASVTVPITSVTLALFYRRLKWPAVPAGLIDTGGDTIISISGATVLRR